MRTSGVCGRNHLKQKVNLFQKKGKRVVEQNKFNSSQCRPGIASVTPFCRPPCPHTVVSLPASPVQRRPPLCPLISSLWIGLSWVPSRFKARPSDILSFPATTSPSWLPLTPLWRPPVVWPAEIPQQRHIHVHIQIHIHTQTHTHVHIYTCTHAHTNYVCTNQVKVDPKYKLDRRGVLDHFN